MRIPRFSSDIRFVPKKQLLAQPIRQDEVVSAPWTIEQRASLKERVLSENILDCNVLGLQNGRRVSLFHLAPKQGNTFPYRLQDIEHAVRAELDLLQREGQPIRALLLGGKEIYPMSQAIGSRIYALLQGAHIPTSVFWGQSKTLGAVSHVYYRADNDTWYISAGSPKPNRRGGVCGAVAVRSSEAIRRQYKVIEVATGDQVYIGQSRVALDTLNQCETFALHQVKTPNGTDSLQSNPNKTFKPKNATNFKSGSPCSLPSPKKEKLPESQKTPWWRLYLIDPFPLGGEKPIDKHLG